MKLLEVDGLTVGYRAEPVLREVDVSIGRGEIVAILGANGAGKTTLLKAIAGLVEPRRGTVRFCGEDLARTRIEQRARRGLILVPEGRRLFRGLTTVDNLRAGRFTEREGDSVEQVLEFFPRLAERSASRAAQLSGGEQQMLAIGRALCGGPELILLDEPSLGLAPLITESLFEALRVLVQRDLGILLAEQNVHAATRAADRCLVIDQGRIVFEGASRTTEERERVSAAYASVIELGADAGVAVGLTGSSRLGGRISSP